MPQVLAVSLVEAWENYLDTKDDSLSKRFVAKYATLSQQLQDSLPDTIRVKITHTSQEAIYIEATYKSRETSEHLQGYFLTVKPHFSEGFSVACAREDFEAIDLCSLVWRALMTDAKE